MRLYEIILKGVGGKNIHSEQGALVSAKERIDGAFKGQGFDGIGVNADLTNRRLLVAIGDEDSFYAKARSTDIEYQIRARVEKLFEDITAEIRGIPVQETLEKLVEENDRLQDRATRAENRATAIEEDRDKLYLEIDEIVDERFEKRKETLIEEKNLERRSALDEQSQKYEEELRQERETISRLTSEYEQLEQRNTETQLKAATIKRENRQYEDAFVIAMQEQAKSYEPFKDLLDMAEMDGRVLRRYLGSFIGYLGDEEVANHFKTDEQLEEMLRLAAFPLDEAMKLKDKWTKREGGDTDRYRLAQQLLQEEEFQEAREKFHQIRLMMDTVPPLQIYLLSKGLEKTLVAPYIPKITTPIFRKQLTRALKCGNYNLLKEGEELVTYTIICKGNDTEFYLGRQALKEELEKTTKETKILPIKVHIV